MKCRGWFCNFLLCWSLWFIGLSYFFWKRFCIFYLIFFLLLDGGEAEEPKKEKLVTATKKGAAVLDQHLPDHMKSSFHVLQLVYKFELVSYLSYLSTFFNCLKFFFFLVILILFSVYMLQNGKIHDFDLGILTQNWFQGSFSC